MEQVNCIICNLDDTEKLVTKNGFDVVKCKRCGLVYVNPRPTGSELASLYSFENYHIGQRNETKQRKVHLPKFKKRLKILESYCGHEGKILDVGCSIGLFLKQAKAFGWQTYGIDISEDAARFARENHKLDVVAGKIELTDFGDVSFDVITFFDSLEHMSNPLAALNKAKAMLNPGGILLISVPNIGGLFPQITYFLLAKPFGLWQHPNPPGHLYDFSRSTLQKLLNKTGLEFVDFISEEIPVSYTLGKLETTLVTFIREIPRKIGRKQNDDKFQEISVDRELKASLSQQSVIPSSLPRRVLRLTVRLACYVITLSIYPIARLLRKGNSMLVMVRKPDVF